MFDREQALRQAMEAFWAHGYEGTSLQDLLAAMSLSKSSFYQSFESKHALFLRTLDHYREAVAAEMSAALRRAPSGRRFIMYVFSEFEDEMPPAVRARGCFVMNCADECAAQDAEVGERVVEGIAHFEGIFREALARACAEGDLAAHADVDVLARYLVTSRSGLKTMAKAGVPPEHLREVVALVYATLGW